LIKGRNSLPDICQLWHLSHCCSMWRVLIRQYLTKIIFIGILSTVL